jgi:hypothetical protein
VARKKWPDTWVDTELAKLRPNWRQWEVGDSVTVVTKEGAQFTERLREINEFQIQVGPNWYRKDDLSAACRQHVDAAFARKTETDERAKLEKQLLANRQTSMREARLDTIRTLYLEHGYMMIAGKWTSKFEYFGRIRQEERERLAAHLRGPLEYKVYYQTGGFREFKGEWYTPEEAAKLREQERIENELRPEEFIAELDDLNRESLVLLATPAGGDDGAGLFDDDAPGKKPAPEGGTKPAPAPGKADPNAKTPSPAHATKAPTP